MAKNLEELLYFYNPWWTKKSVPANLILNYSRPVLQKLETYLELERIIILKGPRRVGKTTLLYQLIANLLEKKVNPYDLFFLPFDDLAARVPLDEIVEAYEIIRGKTLRENKQVYFFLDEIQYDNNWSFEVKKYFDQKFPIKFIISGSASSLIRKTSESLAGRTIEETLLPFSFYEFISFKLQKEKDALSRIEEFRKNFKLTHLPRITHLLPERQQIQILFREYLERGGFPHVFAVKNHLLWKKLLHEDILEKVIYRDLVELYNIRKPLLLEKLFLYLASSSSQILNTTNIAKSLGLSREYIEKYLEYLIFAFLCFPTKKYAKAVESKIRSNEKIHLIDTGLINAFGQMAESKMVETVINRHLLDPLRHLYYWRNGQEVDIIIEEEKKIIPLEVKFKEKIDKEDYKGLFAFMTHEKIQKGIIVTKNLLASKKILGKEILHLPAWVLLLGT